MVHTAGASGRIAAGLALLAAAALAPLAAQANPGARAMSSKSLVAFCGPGPLNGPPCANQSPPRRNVKVLGFLDWRPDPTDRIVNFSHTVGYDPSLLRFDASASSLVCDVRAATAAPFCPTLPAGSGTTPLEAFGSDFTVDQSGLVFTEGADSTGAPTVTATWSAPGGQGISVSAPGERNFLALAFDLLAPLHDGVSVTYSPGPLADATLFSTSDLICQNDSGSSAVCGSTQPSLAVRINNPVPGPLGLGGVSALLWQARRLRRRTGAGR